MRPAPTYAAFPTTHWTLVSAVQGDDAAVAEKALAQICARYWHPIYGFLRNSGKSPQDAEDITQVFFEKLIDRDTLQLLRNEGTKLRSFLLGCLKHTISDHHRHQNAGKRGGLVPHVSIDHLEAEERYLRELQAAGDPEQLFSRHWAQQLFANVRGKLRESFIQTRRGEVFDALLPFISLDEPPPSYREIAVVIGSSEATTRILVYRLREKFREMLREEIALTVETPEDVAAEMAWLRSELEKS